MSDIKILAMFEESLKDFFNELIDFFPGEGDLLVIQIFLRTQIPIEDVMNIFNAQMNMNDGEMKNKAINRNEKFFLEHNLFDVFGKDKVIHFKKLWQSKYMTEQLKEGIWSWVATFIKLGDAYMKVKSKMNITN